MILPDCRACKGVLTLADSRTPFSKHLVCWQCGRVYVWENNCLAACQNPQGHLIGIHYASEEGIIVRPPVIAGPACRGLL